MTNELILASAGSGKTYQLTNRYLALMARRLREGLEPTPEHIIALTFTRKAAGEFFEEILKKLAAGSQSEAEARKLAGDPDDPENTLYHDLKDLTADDYRALLASFVRSSPRLFLGTLDSFFSSIVRSHPAELGLTGDFDILDDFQQTATRQNLLRDIFTRPGNEAGREEFIQAFLLTTPGREEASVSRLLDRFISDHQELLLAAADEMLWGQVATIWPQGADWFIGQNSLVDDFESLRNTLGDISEKSRDFWDEFENDSLTHQAGTPFSTRIKYFFSKGREVWGDIQAGHAILTVNRQKNELDATACASFLRIIHQLLKGEFENRLIRTRGIWQVLRLYEESYDSRIRQRGHLTFADLPLLLAGTPARQAPVLSQREGDDHRLRIDYRLDAQYHHWLLDEFQDTSWQQWSAISNLIDEVLQDDSGDRSLFLVGDTKQAIYAWRGGDSRLFRDIHRQYEHTLTERGLNVSWRSTPPVIGAVNRVFGDRSALGRIGLSPTVIDRWGWPEHEVAGPNQTKPGFTGYYHPSSEIEKPEEEDLYPIILGILEEARPLERGLTCAILVQQNKKAIPLVNYIRQHSDIAIVSESDSSIITDNPVTLAFLSLFRLAAHPHDEFAEGHLKLSPLAVLFEQSSPPAVATRIRAQIHFLGFEGTLRHWLDEAKSAGLAFDDFSRQRMRDFLLAARQFDDSGERSLDRFIAFAENYKQREESTRNTIQVMTIHKSKGLTFDMVILPELGGNALTSPRNSDLAVKRDPVTREVGWVMSLPSRDIAEMDPVFENYRQESEDEAAYEQLCKFYVALTRARYANYLVSAPYSGKSDNFLKLLAETLCQGEPEDCELAGIPARLAYQAGQSDWWNHLPPPKTIEPPAPASPLPSLPPRPRPPRRTPSDHGETTDPRRLFSRSDNSARELGTEVHAIFEEVEWWQEGFQLKGDYGKEALGQFERAMADSGCRAAMTKPDGPVRLWREQNFELLLDSHWVTGTIDRACILLDEDGSPVAARILDFKTDQVANEEDARNRAEAYRSQLQAYRKATSLLLGIGEETITTSLMFTRLPLVVEVS